MCLKSYFKEIVLKLVTNGQSDNGFLLTSSFVPKGLSAPALGLCTWTRCQVSVYRTTGPLVFISHYIPAIVFQLQLQGFQNQEVLHRALEHTTDIAKTVRYVCFGINREKMKFMVT